MSEIAKSIDVYGNENIVNAKEAVNMPKSKRNFRCIGKDPDGRECNCSLELSTSSKGNPYFRGYEHIAKCSHAYGVTEVSMYIESLNNFSFEKFLSVKEKNKRKGGGYTGGGGKGPACADPDDPDKDVKFVEKEKRPTSVRTLYETLLRVPYDYVVDDKKVGDILVCQNTILRGYNSSLDGFKIMVAQRCTLPEGFEKERLKIMVKLSGLDQRDRRYLLLIFSDKSLCDRVWKMIFPDQDKKDDNKDEIVKKVYSKIVLPKILVAGNVSHIRDNVWSCEVKSSRMIARYPY